MALPHKVVVYINGYRFDPLNVTCTFQAQEVCNFQVDVVPVPQWDLLLPRSHGAVFFLDPLTNVYRLMCEGEYVGLSRSKVGTGHRTRTLLFRGLHGAMDDNVHAANTMQFAYELQKANKPFRLMLYPKSRHGVTDSALVHHMRSMMLSFILEHLRPEPTPAGGPATTPVR